MIAVQGLEWLFTAVLVCDQNGQVQYANPAAEDLFMLSRRELCRHALSDLFVDAALLQQALDKAVAQQSGLIEHDLALTLRHDRRTLHATLALTRIEDGQWLLEWQPLDLERRLAHEERWRLQQQANQELIRNLAHEIKNPLGGIRGAAQLLELEIGQRTELLEYTEVIKQEALRLQALVERLLSPHRPRHVTEVNIHGVLEHVCRVVQAEGYEQLNIVRDYDVSLPPLAADEEQLIQVGLNLMHNAAQAMRGQGRITLVTRAARQVTLARRLHPLVVQWQVIDDGPGVPENLREHIFHPLVTGRADGTGLGLTLSQAFVHQHGGSIEFESQPGRTCFTVLLPLGNASAAPAQEGV